MMNSGPELGGSLSVGVHGISSPPAAVSRLQLDQWVVPARGQVRVGGGGD